MTKSKSVLTILNAKAIVLILLPFTIILFFAWYFGFFLSTDQDFNDPCVSNHSKKLCDTDKECIWNNKSLSCRLDSKCNGAAQQECGEGCHWDASVKRPNSNLYGICRPAAFIRGTSSSLELK